MNGEHHILYYLPTIPCIRSTTRYNHALAISELDYPTSLVTHRPPPDTISQRFCRTHVLEEVSSVRDVFDRARKARRLINQKDGNTTVVTTFHYSQVLAGWRSRSNWIVDVFDDPYQQVIHKPAIEHQIGVLLIDRILNRADTAIYTLHPSVPRSFGRNREYGINGAPTELISLAEKPERTPLRCVWVGKTEPHTGIRKMIAALEHTTIPVRVDVYGEPFRQAKSFAKSIELNGTIEFHGNVDHKTVIDGIQSAHVGFCLLENSPDFVFAYPIKIGEYLAGGAYPIASDFPGIRRMCNGVGSFLELKPDHIAAELDRLAAIPRAEFDRLVLQARERANEIAWSSERERFSTLVNNSIKRYALL